MIAPIFAEGDFSQVIFILIFLVVAFFQWLGGFIKKRRGGGEELEQEELARFFEELDEKTTPSDGVPRRPPARPRQPTIRPPASRESAPPPLPASGRVGGGIDEREPGDFVVRRGERSRRALEGDEAVDPLARFRRGRENPVLSAQEAAALKRLEERSGRQGGEEDAYAIEESSYEVVSGSHRKRQNTFMNLLRNPTAARDAIVLKEVFDRPVALRERNEILDA